MKERLQKDLISAMKEHNRKKADTIKSVKAAIQMEEINSFLEFISSICIAALTDFIVSAFFLLCSFIALIKSF